MKKLSLVIILGICCLLEISLTLENVSAQPENIDVSQNRCKEAPFTWPTNGRLGWLWNQPNVGYNSHFNCEKNEKGDNISETCHHAGIDILHFNSKERGVQKVYAVCDGTVTSVDVSKKTNVPVSLRLRCKIGEEYDVPEHDVSVYYTHMASSQESKSYILDSIQAGTKVTKGQHLGYQGDLMGDLDIPVHLHISVSPSGNADEGHSINPSKYFGVDLEYKEGYVPYKTPPFDCELVGRVELMSPKDKESLEYTKEILFKWNDSSKADYKLFQIQIANSLEGWDSKTGFKADEHRLLFKSDVSEPQFLWKDVTPGKYYWTVRLLTYSAENFKLLPGFSIDLIPTIEISEYAKPYSFEVFKEPKISVEDFFVTKFFVTKSFEPVSNEPDSKVKQNEQFEVQFKLKETNGGVLKLEKLQVVIRKKNENGQYEYLPDLQNPQKQYANVTIGEPDNPDSISPFGVPCFQITDTSRQKLQDIVPVDLSKLKSIENKEYCSKDIFIKVIETKIGKELSEENKRLILGYSLSNQDELITGSIWNTTYTPVESCTEKPDYCKCYPKNDPGNYEVVIRGIPANDVILGGKLYESGKPFEFHTQFDANEPSNNTIATYPLIVEEGDKDDKVTYFDVPAGHWAREAIESLAGLGVLTTWDNDKQVQRCQFQPDKPVNRAEFAKMVLLLLKNIQTITLNRNGQQRFCDVPESEWFFPYIDELANIKVAINGTIKQEPIIKGYPETTCSDSPNSPGNQFKPGNNINFAEIFKMLALAFINDEGKYDEKCSGKEWYCEYVQRIVKQGETTGLQISPRSGIDLSQINMKDALFSTFANRVETAKVLWDAYCAYERTRGSVPTGCPAR